MANENDELQQNSDSDNHNSNNSSCNNNQQTKGTATADVAKVSEESPAVAAELRNRQQHIEENKGEEHYDCSNTLTGAKGKLNDLVADLYMSTTLSNGPTAGSSSGTTEAIMSNPGYGDYTNIRATCGPTANFNEGPNREIVGSSNTATAPLTTAPPAQNTFSFKHFLNSNPGNTHAPSSTVTSLDVLINVNTTQQHNNANNVTSNVVTTSATSSSTINSSSFQSSTGARPKVPQSSSISATSISSLMGGGGGGSILETTASGTKMKRSPRFSSFDSQASLAGAAAEATAEEEAAATGSASFSGFRLHPETERIDIFGARRIPSGGCANTSTTNSSDYDDRTQFVPRSYSHYDMQMPPPASPRRRIGGGGGGAAAASDTRPNRLSLAPSNKPRVRLEAHCFPGELPAETAAPPRPNAADFPAAAAALPDFVQDHWLDSWYASEMHLNSPPNSPVCDFVHDLTGGAGISGVVIGSGGGNGGVAASLHDDNPALAANVGGVGGAEPPTQRLPDFLSDGPIIHSSQRLADVAAGLPSNMMNSPEDATMKLQLTSLRIENERYRRELSEARTALTDQTRRTNELERQLLEAQRAETAYNRSMSQQNLAAAQVEESLDQSKRRQAATQSHATKLKQQVKQLTAEVEILRRENESLREDGAVGGCSNINCDRPCSSGGAGGAVAGAAGGSAGGGISRGDVGARGGGGNSTIRPSRSQQISRDLLRAATNAENNLRQLLAGVDNLRQMATDIENSELRLEYDVSPDLYSDFLDECDDYEDYPGGPAL